MPLSRSPSFGDDDLEILSSQTAGMSIGQDASKSPLRPIANPNADIVDLTNSPLGKPISTPVFGQPSQLQSQFTRRVDPNVAFIKRPANRPEHHRDLYRGSGPLKPKTGPKKLPYNQFFSSMSENAQPPSQPSSQNDSQCSSQANYRQAAAAYTDQVFYTDPTKAQADLKALLEGGMEEDEEEKDAAEEGGTIEDGTLEGIKVKLLPHQVEGVQWMQGRESGSSKSKAKGKVPKGGILADDMGLGKTLQSISLIVSNKMPKPEDKGWKKHFENIKSATLVVAPLALIRQWEAEIKDKVSKSHGLKVCVHHGPQRTKDPSHLARYDVVITTYQILVSEHGSSSPDPKGLQAGCFGVHWFRVILDEAHSIKNRNAKATKAACALRSEYRWCLTGTPMQNNLDELQSLVHFLRIEPYDELSHWREQIDLPMKNGRGHIAIRRLHTLLRCFMKRRTKDILKEEGALIAGGKKALDAAAAKAEKEGTAVEAPKPAFKITERKVVTVATEFSPAERKFYNQLEERADKSLEKMIQGKSVNYANALVLLLRLRQACNHPRLAENKLDKDQEALSTDTAAQPKSTADADIDALADALGGMNIQTKRCDMCLSDLSRQEVTDGYARCAPCTKSLDELNGESPRRKKAKKKSRRVSVVTEEIKIEKKRKVRNRGRMILADSDDEDEEADGSWLVSEDQQGSLRLGKAGGEEDENAEGGGEDLDSEDSDRSEEDEDGSQLDSFIVNDESRAADGQLKGGPDDGDSSSSSDDTFVSVSRIQSQVKRLQQQSQQEASELDSDDSESEDDNSGISESELNSDSDSDASPQRPSQRRKKWSKGDPSHVMTSAKIRELIKIVRKEVEEHKFIVFSQFTSMLDLIEPFFRAQSGFKAVRYDGKMPNDQREAALHALRTDPHTRILLCSLKCGSLGLNLTAATRVVIVEPFWNPFVEEQAIDRVHRLTQTIDVVIYKLTVAGTVEERIVELQNKKRLLAEAAIEGGMRKKGKDALKLGLAEIMELFKHDGRAPEDTGYSRDPEDNSVVRQDIGEMVRGMVGIVRRKEVRQEHEVYGRRW
ncbi:hypothetical protein GQ53DRAFT_462445 [Thozetella sp. PMI_491]|nr:hypothetical protein GQ53DRAFT_462445 [Thozetella sp. PMI_491]